MKGTNNPVGRDAPANVLIPIYKATLSPEERVSLERAYRVLAAYPLVVVKPASLDLSALAAEYPALRMESFPDAFFQGIAGYNRLMLSEAFYERFADRPYLLVYQLDAYVFRDELAAWCAKGYDYVGAPWLRRPVYRLPFVAQVMSLIQAYHRLRRTPSKQDLYGKVGNGGLSLRKVSSHLRVLRERRDRVAYYLAQRRYHLYNEDVFWATEPRDFSYPEAEETLRFSFDKYPAYCYRLTGGKLPFGCHAWYKRKMREFWKRFIPFPTEGK